MASPRERSFTLVTDFTRQLITLCAAIVALEVSFVASSSVPLDEATRRIFGLSWCVFLGSIVFGLLVFQKFIGEDARQQDEEARPPNPYSGWIRRFAFAQIVLFLLAVALGIVAGWRVL
ncbi:hypothetical protein [Janibacter alittae]|uniref:DUF202 domain-containing protein n=1 Tax=Janibacter alittae TaxID=3115209 RepID=A0ABZ2MGD3_9MICO